MSVIPVAAAPNQWDRESKLPYGNSVNLETDLIGKHVRRTMQTEQAPTPLTLDRLRDAGFGEG